MNKKFSIVKTMDVTKLCQELDNYRNCTGEEHPYIFMNDSTIEEVMRECKPMCFPYGRLTSGYVAKFAGYKVFVNNDLTFGEVEIR